MPFCSGPADGGWSCRCGKRGTVGAGKIGELKESEAETQISLRWWPLLFWQPQAFGLPWPLKGVFCVVHEGSFGSTPAGICGMF